MAFKSAMAMSIFLLAPNVEMPEVVFGQLSKKSSNQSRVKSIGIRREVSKGIGDGRP
jgi:hypothetical protein